MPNEIESENEIEIQIHDENETTDGSENQESEGEQIDSHVRIPVGGLIADLDDRLRRMREEITIQARRLGSHLLTLADAVESAPASHVAPMAVGEMGTRIDRACASSNATKELRVWLGRVAYQHRAAARKGT